MANRINAAIERMEKQIKQRIADGITTAAKVAETHKKLDMQWDEYSLLQERKNISMMEGKLTLEETTTIYQYLGESLETFNNQPVAVKAVLTQVLAELLKTPTITAR